MGIRTWYLRGKTGGKTCAVIFAITCGIWLAATAQTARAQDRFAVGAQVGFQSLPELGETAGSYGFRFTYGAYPPFIAIDSEINMFPTHTTGNLGQTQFFLGPKIGARVGRLGVFFKVRPGFDHFGGGIDPGRLTRQTNFALDFGGGVEYYFAPNMALRWDLSDVMTHFGSGEVLSPPGNAIGLPLGTVGNFETTVGIMVHF